MYPVAWGVAQRERRETWEWFTQFMQDDLEIGDGHGWTIISDQQKVNLYLPEGLVVYLFH